MFPLDPSASTTAILEYSIRAKTQEKDLRTNSIKIMVILKLVMENPLKEIQ